MYWRRDWRVGLPAAVEQRPGKRLRRASSQLKFCALIFPFLMDRRFWCPPVKVNAWQLSSFPLHHVGLAPRY